MKKEMEDEKYNKYKEKTKLTYINFLAGETKRDTRRVLTILLISMK